MTDQPQPQPGAPGTSGAWQPVPGGGDYDPDQTMHVSFAAQLPPEPLPGEDPLGAHGPAGEPDPATQWSIPVIRDEADGDSGEFSVGSFAAPWDRTPPPAPAQSFPAGMFGQGAAAAAQAQTPSPAQAAHPAEVPDHPTGQWALPFAGPDAAEGLPWPPAEAAWSAVVDDPEGPPPAALDAPEDTATGHRAAADSADTAFTRADPDEDAYDEAARTRAPGDPDDDPEPPAVHDGPDAYDGPGVHDAPHEAVGDLLDGDAAAGDEDTEEPPPPTRSEHPLASYVLRVNGADRPVTDAWLGESLLYVLRERLGLAGAKDGCEQGECGACSVKVDGRLVASCLVPAATAAGSEVRTVEGLTVDGRPSDVQRALADSGAVQCGFCVPGLAMTVHDLLEGNHRPTELETRQALCGNLCRCSGYRGVLDAVGQVVAAREAEGEAEAAANHPLRVPHQGGPAADQTAGGTV